MHSPRSCILVIVLASLVIGCGTSSNLHVVGKGGAHLLAGVKQYEAERIRFVDLQVDGKPEAEWLAKKDDDEARKAWAEDKASVQQEFQNELWRKAAEQGVQVQLPPATARFKMRPTVSAIDTGYYRIPAWSAITRFVVKVRILDAQNNLVEEIEVTDGAAFDAAFAAASGGRLRAVAKSCGEMLAEHLVKYANQ